MSNLLKDFEVEAKNPSVEALQAWPWRSSVSVVKNRARRFRILSDHEALAENEKKRNEIQEKIRVAHYVQKAALQFIDDGPNASYVPVPEADLQQSQQNDASSYVPEADLQQSSQPSVRIRKRSKRFKKIDDISGLNNAVNSTTVVAIFIATVAFTAIFTIPGQYEEDPSNGALLGQAHIANRAEFVVFFIFDCLALFISLAVIVVQTSFILIEEETKKKVLFVIDKLMWCACLSISIAFVSLSFIVVGKAERWLAVYATVIGCTIMITTVGTMCYFVVMHKMGKSKSTSIKKTRSKSR